MEFQRKIHEEILTISDTSGSLDADTTDVHNEANKDESNQLIGERRPATSLANRKLEKQNSFSASDRILNKDRAQIQYTSNRNLSSCNHFKKIEHQLNSRVNDFKFSASSIETGEENPKRIYLTKSETNYAEKNTGNLTNYLKMLINRIYSE